MLTVISEGVKMRTKAVAVILSVVGVVLLVLGVVLYGWSDSRWLFSRYWDIDTSSGDTRERTVFLGRQIRERVKESLFSHEVRRLHIHTPEVRVWKSTGVSTLHGWTMGPYSGADSDCNFLVQMFDVMRASDEDRIDVLQKALSNLRAGELDATDQLIEEVSNQLRQFLGLPPVPVGHLRPVFNQHRVIR